jgi:hypothetical protein
MSRFHSFAVVSDGVFDERRTACGHMPTTLFPLPMTYPAEFLGWAKVRPHMACQLCVKRVRVEHQIAHTKKESPMPRKFLVVVEADVLGTQYEVRIVGGAPVVFCSRDEAEALRNALSIALNDATSNEFRLTAALHALADIGGRCAGLVELAEHHAREWKP